MILTITDIGEAPLDATLEISPSLIVSDIKFKARL